ncbi:ribosomal RNA small subunit methyltransferase A [Polaromonas glacialis]|uniref:ribosomal RNA small subunit methyltransferase A n=1 Tax=Polaromonas glacialis TaxID=866564 RepID=UPI0004963B3A|nr:rRNA adenine dimethyltransferase family protein [Polaromonas glacialis]
MKHIPRKRFGQHFLTDRLIIDSIVEAIAPLPGQPMVEIGPGLAAMTRPLVARLGHLTVIELDRDLAHQLRTHPHLTVVESDVLRVDFRQLAEQIQLQTTQAAPPSQSGPRDWLRQTAGAAAPSGGSEPREAGSAGAFKLRVVGNLPYNISTPILFHLLDAVDVIEDQHFMLQKEVIDRMVAVPSTSDYGRLSVMLQWRYAMENVLHVPPQSFDPPPRVDSAIVRMVPHAEPQKLDVKLLSELVRVAFSQRRKLLRHTLGKWLEQHDYAGEFDVRRRAEEVPVAEYLALAQQVKAGTAQPESTGIL